MQKILIACKHRLHQWRIQREASRIHRQALRKARTSYDAIPLQDRDSYRRLVELNRERERLYQSRYQAPGEGVQ